MYKYVIFNMYSRKQKYQPLNYASFHNLDNQSIR